MNELAMWIKSTDISQAIIQSQWLWPACETLHFVGLALLVGIAGMLDLRLLGVIRHVPVASIHRLVKWAMVGFAINVITGLVFLVGAPDQYLENIAWWFKVLFLVIAGLNALFFETTQGRRVLALGADEPMPPTFKVVGAVSLFSWFMVMYWGRMLAFVGNAF